ncbi:MAG TPA: hypothetical protein VIB39_09080 [Candidatus Angelobacter sp.]|jgi:hypothetical protein
MRIAARGAGKAPAASVGELLLDLRDALQRAQRCRLALQGLGYSHKRWQEIVRDIDPDLRFALRPQILDAILSHLQGAGKPVNRKALTRILHMQEVGTLQRIRQAITLNLRSGNLLLYPGNRIGLPAWKGREQESSVAEGG